jgi:hypothetical protein
VTPEINCGKCGREKKERDHKNYPKASLNNKICIRNTRGIK